MATTKPTNIDEYIAEFPKDVQKLLEQVRNTIQKAAPEAEEKISYGIATFTWEGKYLIYFAGHKSHIGMYPVPDGNEAFKKDFSKYKTSGKGAIQFPFDQPLPLALITKIVKFRLKERRESKKQKDA